MEGLTNKELFDRHGLKNTKHRNQVYDILKQADNPRTPEEIYRMLKERDASISFSTIYRILDAFAAKGIAGKCGAAGNGSAAFELNHGHRHRLFCTACNRTVPIEGCPLEQYEQLLERQTKFDITAHRLEVFGLCPECKSKE